MIDPKAPTARRLVISRVLLIIVALIAAYTAGNMGADILFLVAWAFSIAAAGLFAALVMGVWYKRTTNIAACAGMAVGYIATFGYLIWTEFYGWHFIQTFGSKDAILAAARQMANLAAVAPELKAQAAAHGGQCGVGPGRRAGLVRQHLRRAADGHRGAARPRWSRGCGRINNISGGIIGVPLSFLTIWLVSMFTPAPSKAMQDFIEDIRVPRGGVRLADQKAVVE